jgi:hypothetical protein
MSTPSGKVTLVTRGGRGIGRAIKMPTRIRHAGRVRAVNGAAMRVHFSTDDLPPRDREQLWRDVVGSSL